MIYLDNAATTHLDDEVLNAMISFLQKEYGNPSAIYELGKTASLAIEEARKEVAEVINARPEEIYFTSGGTEADNTAILGVARVNKSKGRHIITTKIEHKAVLETCKALEKEGFDITYLDVDEFGLISINDLKEAIRADTILISIMFANNEVGTIEPIYEIGKIAKKYGVLFHTDAVQAIGNIRINVEELNIDLLSMSAHKFYGPKGTGVLYVRKGISFDNLIHGGGQENGKRSGTENVAGIVGTGKAIYKAYQDFEEKNKKIQGLREYFIKEIELQIPNAVLNGERFKRLPGNANFSFGTITGANLVKKLNEEGICASSGSACSSGFVKPSHVLLGMRLERNRIETALRITIGKNNTKEDIEKTIQVIKKYTQSKTEN